MTPFDVIALLVGLTLLFFIVFIALGYFKRRREGKQLSG